MGLPIAHASIVLTAVGSVIMIALGALYLRAAAKPSPRGNRWPLGRTACFIGGLLILWLVVQSPLADHDDVRWVHSAQHLIVMMLVPPLLVLGSPITLLLRSVGPNARREIVGILHDPAMKKVSGRAAGVGLTLEYHGTMFIVMLTGVYGYTLEHDWAHIAVHAYLLTCGLLFWMPLVGRDPTGFRPPHWAKLTMVGVGLPAYVLLGALMADTDQTAAWVVAAGGVVLTLGGLALVAAQRTGTRAGSRAAEADPEKRRRRFAISSAMKTQQAMDSKR